MDDDTVIGFLDESSPQTTSNTQRLWSFTKPTIYKNTTKLRANSFGFYTLNGNSVIDFKEHSKKEDVCEFLAEIKDKNPKTKIIVVLDNFASHRANDTKEYAEKNGIELIYLPPYSPDLNPIEFIWKSIKKVISREFIIDIDHMRDLIHEKFMECSSKISFAKRWIEKFLSEKQKSKMLGV
jgi:transposase